MKGAIPSFPTCLGPGKAPVFFLMARASVTFTQFDPSCAACIHCSSIFNGMGSYFGAWSIVPEWVIEMGYRYVELILRAYYLRPQK
jgi:hypothetical protein